MKCAGAYTEDQKLSGMRLRLVCKAYEDTVLPRSGAEIRSFTARKSKPYGNKHNFSEDETKLAHRQKVLQTGLYRGRYATWSNDKEKTDNANRLSGAEVITEFRALSDNREFDDTYIELSDGSVVEALSSTGYQYTPSSQVKKTDVVIGGNYPSMQVPDFRLEPSTRLANGYAYRFGIDGITVQHWRQYEECGFVSNPVNIGTCSFIELEVETSGSQDVEFYILDGDKETPILPVGEDRVEKERLCYQMPLRFVADENEGMTIFKDGVATDASMADRDGFDYAHHVYEIAYTPSKTSHRYFPKNRTVQVKVLQRSASLPATIKSVAIRKHGGGLDWTTLD